MSNTVKAPTEQEFNTRYKFSPAEVAALLGRTEMRIRQFVASGKVKGVRFETSPTGRKSGIEILRSGVLEMQALSRGETPLLFSKPSKRASAKAA